MSALYSYELLVNTTLSECSPEDLMGKRVTLEIKNHNTLIQKTHGIIMSIESSRSYLENNDPTTEDGKPLAWYRWIIRPTLARACYSKNRLVYSANDLRLFKIENTAAPQPSAEKSGQNNSDSNISNGENLLKAIAKRWDTAIKISTAAKARIPDFIQLIQNNESDYNFLCRVLAAWGLGYVWQMGNSTEELCIVDMLGADRDYFKTLITTADGKKKEEEITFSSMEGTPHSGYWQANYGYRNVGDTAIRQENYGLAVTEVNATSTAQTSNAAIISLHDETWDQLQDSGSSLWTTAHYLSANDNTATCHGHYVYAGNTITGSKADPTYVNDYQNIGIGRKAKWRKLDNQVQCDTKTYYQTKLTVTAKNTKWIVSIEGRAPKKGDAMGILPRPVKINNHPELNSEQLIKTEPWPTPQMRTFMAVVEEEGLCNNATGRNLCKVKELTKLQFDDKNTLSNSLWVELGSPFADANSGLLSRPRKGNILFCLDRGDLSIPIVLSAMFRNGNQMPIATLASNITDSSTLTIRNRSHNAGTNNDVAANINDYSVPRSVHKLWTDKPNCSQIQLVSKDNGISPKVYHNGKVSTGAAVNKTEGNFGKDVSSACIAESALGIIGGVNLSNAMVGKLVNVNTAEMLASPDKRPHFQGINISSEKDILQQSIDSQFINAGGIINITAASGIVLRVGRNVIQINENGIEMTGGMGSVTNPGAHAAYNTTEPEAVNVTATYSGALVLNQTGAKLAGTNTKMAAVNDVRMEVAMGSIVEMNNYEINIASPHTTITGGAALLNTIYYGGSFMGTMLTDVLASQLTNSDAKAHQKRADQTASEMAALADSISSFTGTIGSFLDKDFSKYGNLFRISGSIIDLKPGQLFMASEELKNYFSTIHHGGSMVQDSITADYEAFFHNGLVAAGNNIGKAVGKIGTGVKNVVAAIREFHLSKHKQHAEGEDFEGISDETTSLLSANRAVNHVEETVTEEDVNAELIETDAIAEEMGMVEGSQTIDQTASTVAITTTNGTSNNTGGVKTHVAGTGNDVHGTNSQVSSIETHA